MSYQLILSQSGASYDITDYVTEIGDIPILYERNADRTQVISSVNVNVSTAFGLQPSQSALIFYKMDSTSADTQFQGVVKNTTYNYSTRMYELDVESSLSLLRDTVLESGNLYNELTGSADLNEFNPSDNEGYINYQALYVMKKMFQKVGLTLITTAVDDTITFNYNIVGGYYATMKEITVDAFSIYAINQNIAAAYSLINASSEYSNNKISFWDFINKTCANFGLVIFSSANKVYKMYHKNQLLTFDVSDDYKYGYKEEIIPVQYDAVREDTRYASRNLYYGGLVSDLDKPSALTPVTYVPKRKKSLDWLNNLWFRLRESGSVTGAVTIGHYYTPNVGQGVSTVTDFQLQGLYPQTEKEYITEITGSSVTNIHDFLYNKIDMENRLSKIKTSVVNY